jgi:hypothetical protein
MKLAWSVGSAVVGKRGVRWKGGRYWSPAFVEDGQACRNPPTRMIWALFIFDGAGNYRHRRELGSAPVDGTAVRHGRASTDESSMTDAKAELRVKQRHTTLNARWAKCCAARPEQAGKLVTCRRRANSAPRRR